MSGPETTRRALLRALAAGGLGLASGCLVPSRPPPVIVQPTGPRLAIPRRGRARGLWVGAASVDVTPPPGSSVLLAGFGFGRSRREVRDPISARCLYFDDGTRRVALVVADVIGVLHPSVERIRGLVGRGVEVAVASTHNHQSPDTMGFWGRAILHAVPHRTGIDPAYLEVFERRLALSVALAASAARPARLGFARAELPDGLVRNLRSPGVYDRTVEVLEATAQDDGAPLASFVCFACHPETLGDRGRALTADFPGRLRADLERSRGGTSVFANGALGGMITPELDDALDPEDRVKVMERLGSEVARVAHEALGAARRVEVREIRYRRAPVELPVENELFRYVQRVGLVEPHRPGPAGGLMTEVGRIDLGPASWALMPGEPTPMVGLRVKAALGVEHPALIALANDELGYLLDPAQAADPEFEYEVSMSVGPQTAPRLEAALRAL